jgi:antitoxin (DNA-binding transcriptional repressor) of toxin-antitoxin stability system
VQSPNVKGAVAELEIELAATRLGIPVLKPVAEHGRYDLGLEIGDRLFRVQCKWGRLINNGAVIRVNVGGNRTTPAGYVRSVYSRAEVDLIAVYCGDIDRSYVLPIALVEGRHQVQLRLRPPANGQRAFVNLASDYEFEGAVAQLARAPVWHTGGRGFESPQLHSPPRNSEAVVVGADEFRNRLGWYMQRAAAGEQFHVERRGRAYVRLTGAAPQLRLRTDPSLDRRSRGVFVGRYAADRAAA